MNETRDKNRGWRVGWQRRLKWHYENHRRPDNDKSQYIAVEGQPKKVLMQN
jgi:hypothetical protein